MGTCTISDCEKELRSPGAIYCKMHYHRWYRHGDPTKTARESGVSVRKPRKYKNRWAPSHPLATAGGNVWEHRVVLYDALAGATPVCHWCSASLDWFAYRGSMTSVHVDHLNGITDDNDIKNLVPSCRGCNAGRGAQERAEVLRSHGYWSSHDTIERLTATSRREPIVAAS